jgi:PIN like domain
VRACVERREPRLLRRQEPRQARRAGALRVAGAQIEVHDDHFPQDAPDELWLPEVGRRGWAVLTKDDRIRYLCLPKSPSARPRPTRIRSTRAPADGLAAGGADLAATGPFCDPRWYARPAARPRCRGPRRVLPPRRPRSGEPRPAPAARDPRPAAAPAAALRPRPRLLGRPREALARLARHARHRAARHRHPLAPPRLPSLLALAVAPDRTPLDQGRHADAHPSHRLREPGWGAPRVHGELLKARHRRRPVHHRQVHAAAEPASLADLAPSFTTT